MIKFNQPESTNIQERVKTIEILVFQHALNKLDLINVFNALLFN